VNIFVTDSDPVKSAQALDDVRLNKMILESVQMLSSALHINGLHKNKLPKTLKGEPYKPTHTKHPCTIWVSVNRANYNWLLAHLKAMIEEYSYRTGKVHGCSSTLKELENGLSSIPQGDLAGFQNSSEFKSCLDTVEAYRKTMNFKWKKDKIKLKWSKRHPPEWIDSSLNVLKTGDAYLVLRSVVS
jgi:hypothetical protein